MSWYLLPHIAICPNLLIFNSMSGFLQSTIGNSRRSSAATAYLDIPGVLNRTNLDVLIMTQVNRLIRTSNGSNGVPEFKSVEVQQTPDGT